MKTSRRFYHSATFLVLAILVLIGCSHEQSTTEQQVAAIDNIRSLLGLPNLALDFVDTSNMINSPSGDLQVAGYQDTEGRNYFVDSENNQVVEIDARAILLIIPLDAPALSENDLRMKAKEIIAAAFPDFELLQSSLSYEEGAKGGNYFFTWYADAPPGYMNRPFAQIGLYESGDLFAYYNTLMFK